ncbi:MAG: DUF4256 domain-containing protein [Christensenellales bacterium]|jgi:hypothetical protein
MEAAKLNETLKKRFEQNMQRHPGILWEDICKLLTQEHWDILSRMEEAGGEPDVLAGKNGGLLFGDCCKETPQNRRSVCYDEEARLKRKNNPPEKSAWGIAKSYGALLMDEETYKILQKCGSYDEKGQVWLATDDAFRRQGDALFANLRHGRVFIYYNGAESYYRIRGFRCMLLLNGQAK